MSPDSKLCQIEGNYEENFISWEHTEPRNC